MRKPRLEDFDTSNSQRKVDDINIAGIVPLSPKPELPSNKTVFVAPEQNNQQDENAQLPENWQSGNMANRQSGKPDSQNAPKPESLFDRSLAEMIEVMLNSKAAKKESFRFPEELALALEDISYEVKKGYGKRVTKTSIFVAALANYLWEFKHKGDASQLYQQLIALETA